MVYMCSQQQQQDMAYVDVLICVVDNMVYMGAVHNSSKTWHMLMFSGQHGVHGCSQQ